MSPEDIQKSIQLLEKSEHVALIFPPETNADCCASAETIAKTLSSKNKRVGFLTPPNTETMPRPEIYGMLQKPSFLLKEFIISLDTTHAPASELRYEREEERIDIILSPKTKALSSDMVSFREGKTLCDCIISLGISDIDLFDSLHIFDPSLFTEAPLINLDIQNKNIRYGEVNIITPDKSSLSELTYEFLVALYKEPLSAEYATLLLSGIIEQTDGFKPPRTNADTLLAASELTRLGARQDEAFALSSPRTPLALVQLFGRASVRSKIDHERHIIWSFLTSEDFEKTERSPADAPYVLTRLKSEFTSEKFCILLWQQQENNSVLGIITGTVPLLELILAHTGGELHNSILRLNTSYSSFRDAEEQLSELLTTIV